jgi:hypothetical protein
MADGIHIDRSTLAHWVGFAAFELMPVYDRLVANLKASTNRGFAEWGEVFGDTVVATALLDLLLHHAVVIQIEGSSYRLSMPRSFPRTSEPARTSTRSHRSSVVAAHPERETRIKTTADPPTKPIAVT